MWMYDRGMGAQRVFFLGVLALSCGSGPLAVSAADGGTAPRDAASLDDASHDAAADAGVTSRPHARLPVVGYRGGRLLVSPEVVTVTFPGDPLRPRLEAFDDAIVQSAWWSTVTEGYCVSPAGTPCIGKGSSGGHVVFGRAPEAVYSARAVADLVSSRVSDGTLPPPHPGTIYALYFPANVALEDGMLKSCADFTAYHSFAHAMPAGTEGGAPVSVAYIAVPRCAPGEADATIAAAHQLVDAATDPDGDAYAATDEAWSTFFLGEAADLCSAEATAVESGFAVPRVWSNLSAAAGHDPCVPRPTGNAYFNASPPEKLLSLSIGETTTIAVAPYAEAAAADWTLSAVDYDELAGKLPTLALKVFPTTVNDGTPATLTITLLNAPPERGFGLFALVSRRGKVVHYWPGRVLPK